MSLKGDLQLDIGSFIVLDCLVVLLIDEETANNLSITY